jgi:hypothetical protein
MQREKKLRSLRIALGYEGSDVKGDEVTFFCPKHGARAGRTQGQLSVNLKTDRFHCWSCGYGGKNLVPLLRVKGNTSELQEYLSELEQALPSKSEEPKKVYDTPVLPKEFKSLSKASRSPYYGQAMEYLSKRGVTLEDILRYKLGYCEDGEYKYRIIIPSFDEHGELNFFSGRSWLDNPVLRYKNGNFCKDVIFNDYLIDWDEPVTITEGPFDAFRAGDNTIPLLGDLFDETTKLFRKIVTSGTDTYFAMDTDAYKKQLKIIEKFVHYGINCYYVGLNGQKDVGSMSRENFQEAKRRARPVRSDMDLLKLRIMA